jgi:hypothetical protein
VAINACKICSWDMNSTKHDPAEEKMLVIDSP